jgi:hypothetical protein
VAGIYRKKVGERERGNVRERERGNGMLEFSSEPREIVKIICLERKKKSWP